jgi:hypothetical protein
MSATPLATLGDLGWEYGVIAGIGLAIAGMVYALGRLLTDRAPKRGADPIPLPPPSPAAPEPSIDPFVEGVFGEKRAALRRQGNPVAVLISDAKAAATPYYGWVLDRSVGGLLLSVETAVAVGTVMSVRPTNAPETAPWVQVEVKHCQEEGRTWRLGCQFLKTPSWGVLLLFG